MSSPFDPVTPALAAGAVGGLRLVCDRCPNPATLGMASVTCPGCTLRMNMLLCNTCYFWEVRINPAKSQACCDTCGATVAPSMIGSVDFIINL